MGRAGRRHRAARRGRRLRGRGGRRRPRRGAVAADARPRAAARPAAGRRPRRRARAGGRGADQRGERQVDHRGDDARRPARGDLIRLSAFEGAQLYGDTLPLDADPGTGFDKIGFTVRQPCGVVVAITPFNYPALLVLHKIAPALAAGNAVVLKPARSDPAHRAGAGRVLLEAGLPEGVLSVLTGPGGASATRWWPTRGCARCRSPARPAIGERIAARPG